MATASPRVCNMLRAIRPAAITGSTIRAATSRTPTIRIDSATVVAASTATRHVEPVDRKSLHARALLVERHARESPVRERDRTERERAERGDDGEIAARDGEDRAEQVLEQVDVERAGARDEHDTERDPRVEDEGERLVTGRATLRAQPLDRDRAEDRGDECCEHRRHVEQIAGSDAREGDVTDAVADERLPALDEEEADGRARARRRRRRPRTRAA